MGYTTRELLLYERIVVVYPILCTTGKVSVLVSRAGRKRTLQRGFKCLAKLLGGLADLGTADGKSAKLLGN